MHHRLGRALAAIALVTGGTVALAAPAHAADPSTFTHAGNPILADGSYYSADPAPLVVGDQLYVYTGHDEAGPATNDFQMNEWGAFRTGDVASGQWTHYPSLLRPETVFAWATPGRAYAGQMVQGPDGRFYWYLPVSERTSTAADKFAIGLAVSDSPTGPWTDYVGGPLISQRVPTANTIQNIDPTILVEGQRVFVYWGTFGALRMLEYQADMKTPVGTQRGITGLTGFFEAPWLFKRNGTYYMAYAGNNAGPTSACTPANYHACIAYATAAAPEGPWTYRGTVLAPVSSTTSHPGIIQFGGQWYITYHTAGAVGGGHFRRSVAIDKVDWDDTLSPPRMKLVTQTPVKGRDLTPRANIAQEAKVTVSNEPVPTQYWVKALNDELVRANPLPPDMWGTWTGSNPPQQWVQYTWDQPMRISGSQIDFWNDQAQGTGVGVAAPARWKLQYWNAGWVDVPSPSGYPTSTAGYQNTTFDAVTTTQVRAVFDASTNGSTYSAVAVEEWKILAAQPPSPPTAAPMTVEVGETELPGTVTAGGLSVPVYWDPVNVSAPGVFSVQGTVLGYAAGRITGQVTVISPGDTAGDVTAPTLTVTPSGSAGIGGWFRSAVKVRAAGVDDRGGRLRISASVDAGPAVVAEPVRYTDIQVSGDGVHGVAVTATDRAGNVSLPKNLFVRIDATSPVSTAVVNEAARSVSVTAVDATSGVAQIEYSIDGGAWIPYSGPTPGVDSNKHVVSYRATDAAGNVETARSVTIAADISGPLTGNVAPIATATASYTAGWNSVTALNDNADPANPGQAQIWGTWSGTRPATQWTQYDWARPVRLISAELKFWKDSNKGTGDGVAEPDGWKLQYWTGTDWADVANPSAYGTGSTGFNTVTFTPVTTSRLRATYNANGNGTTYSAVAVTEWRAFADEPGPAFAVTAQGRCIAGKAYVAVQATNNHTAALDITVETLYGDRAFPAVAPGANAYQSFATRAATVPAGTVTVRSATTVLTAAYPAVSC